VIGRLLHQAEAIWFACLGLPLTDDNLAHATAYLAALNYPASIPIRGVPNWQTALTLTRDPQWDRRWWEAEQAERVHLMSVGERRLGRTALLERLSAGTELTGQAIHGAAAIAAERDGVGDAALVRAASGAATMALHAATLARVTGQGPEHLFVRKYTLFESGRWPLGVVGGAFHLF
jgi:hypothetical protein